MAGKKGKGSKRPKTAVNKSNKKDILDVDRPKSAPTADEQAAFLKLKYEIYGMSLYQQIYPESKFSYFPKVSMNAMKKSRIGGDGGGGGKGKGKKGKGKKKK